MISTPVNIGELRQQFPFPWTYQQYANGLIRVLDAAGNEVPLPQLVGLVVTLTAVMHRQAQST